MTTAKTIEQQLQDFDLSELDLFEAMQYEQLIKSMPKNEALQVLINTVEGDISQLSEGLAEIAMEQEK